MLYSSENNIQNFNKVFKELYILASVYHNTQPLENSTFPLAQGALAIIVLLELSRVIHSLTFLHSNMVSLA